MIWKNNIMKSEFRSIHSWTELLEITATLREKGETITNFYPNEAEMTDWIENDSFLFTEINENAACLVHKTNGADFLCKIL